MNIDMTAGHGPSAAVKAALEGAGSTAGLDRVATGVLRLRVWAYVGIAAVAAVAFLLGASAAVGALPLLCVAAVAIPWCARGFSTHDLQSALITDAGISTLMWWLFGPVAGLNFLAFYVVAAGGILLPRRRALATTAAAVAAEGIQVGMHFWAKNTSSLPLFHDPGQVVTDTEFLGGSAVRVLVLMGLAVLFMTIAAMLRRSLTTLEESGRLYQDLYEHAPTAYFSVGSEGQIELVNNTATELLGYSREELLSMHVFDLYAPGPDGKEGAAGVFTTFREGREVRGRELVMRRKDGTSVWVSLSVGIDRDENGAILSSRSMIQDISHRKEAEQQARALAKAKDDFVAAVSHELRTPLTSVVGFSSLLASADGELSPDEQYEMIKSVSREATDLAHIVEDLLVVARTDVGTLRIRTVPVDLRAQSAQVIESLDPHETRIVEEPTRTVRVLGDPSRVRQILRNLISNAHRYGGDHIRVRVGNGGPFGVIEVWDDGRGIKDDDRERIFQPYESAHDPGGLAASVGLGLSVSRRLATSMGGDLRYRREEGHSVFSLRLPLASSLLGAHGLPQAV